MTVVGKLFYSPLILENYFSFHNVKRKFISSNLSMNILLEEIETANEILLKLGSNKLVRGSEAYRHK